jgi:phage tail sheath protein FI
MPTAVTYPGVYIEEVPSGLHTIVGVATSITAFVGRAQKGPVDKGWTIFSLEDYQRTFGAIDPAYPLSYAVRDFFVNGGTQAIIVRVFKPTDDATRTARTATASLPLSTSDNLTFHVASPGASGNQVRIWFNFDGIDNRRQSEINDIKARFNSDNSKLYNLFVSLADPDNPDAEKTAVETFLNVSNEGKSLRRIDRVLLDGSSLIRVDAPPIDARPTGATGKRVPFASGHDSDPLIHKEDFRDPQQPTKGLFALDKVDLFNVLCIPPDILGRDLLPAGEISDFNSNVLQYCKDRRAFYIIDSLPKWDASDNAAVSFIAQDPATAITAVASGSAGTNGAMFFPRIVQSVQVNRNQPAQLMAVSPCGTIAGIFARTDAARGVWKAPAGIEATILGAQALAVRLTDAENGVLNPLALNCLRDLSVAGRVVWGARTLRGADRISDLDNKYIPVRRFTLFLEESLSRGTKFALFEPNDEPLWSQLRLTIGAFMQDLFLQGAFAGRTPAEAYFVKCDSTTTTPNEINLGRVNVLVGFAPLKPAEFVVIKIQQIAGQTAA